MGHGIKSLTSITIGELQAGDCIEARTAHSKYRFWIEFPDEAIGIVSGGALPGPTRARIVPEHALSAEAATSPLRVGQRLQFSILGPVGNCIRRFVTSHVEALVLYPAGRVAA